MPIKTAAIIGAGIAGLTCALALARHGVRTEIFEQADRLIEVGAGLQVSPNASRILGTLGVLDALRSVWLEPEEIRLVSGRSLRPIAAIPCGSFARERWGAPYGAVHRATLQKTLLDAVQANPLCRLHLGRPIHPASRPAVNEALGKSVDLIVGADGVWSTMRSLVPGAAAPRFSGNIACRFTIPEGSAPAFLSRTEVVAFLGPSAHLVYYPIREAKLFNVVAITAGNGMDHGWDNIGTTGGRDTLLQRFSHWNGAIGDMLASQAQPTFWPLYETGPGRWHDRSDTVLIGDAAHAMTPFAAQGAGMAIEDAFELAGLVASRPLPEALALFETQRSPRIARLRKRAAFNRFAYHASGPARFARDLVLGLRPPQSLAADLDWLYGYRALG